MEVVNKLGRFIKLEEVSHTIHALFWVRKRDSTKVNEVQSIPMVIVVMDKVHLTSVRMEPLRKG
jgi:hypothetical protein